MNLVTYVKRTRCSIGVGTGGAEGAIAPPATIKGGRTYRSAPPLLAWVNVIHNPKWCQLRSNIRIAQSINMYNIAVNQIMLTAANSRSRRINCHINCWLDRVFRNRSDEVSAKNILTSLRHHQKNGSC